MAVLNRAISRRDALLAVALTSGLLVAAAPAVAQNAQPVRVRGTVVSLDGATLVVKSREGENVTIQLNDNARVASVLKASMADIKPGVFVGIAAMPDGDGLKSLEVLVLPEAMRGVGEGHYPWDLKPNSNMTNGTVGDSVQGVDGRTVTVSYKGGEKKLAIPDNVPIVTFGPAQMADLKPGVPVVVFAQKGEGGIKSGFVAVGKDGVVPPM